MAIYNFDTQNHSRGKGDAIVAKAAYRSGERLIDHYYGEEPDFTRKGGIVHTMILKPPATPEEFSDRETLWNEVEFREDKSTKRAKARLAREVKVALPRELTLEENIRMVEQYVIANFVDKGMIADVCFHDKGDRNPHVHILLTTRYVDEHGFGKKNRNWDKTETLEQWRREWANTLNRELEQRGLETVRHESLAYLKLARDTDIHIERKPTIHLGYQVKKLEKIGIMTDRMREYLEIVEHNRELELKRERKRQRSRGRG